LYHIDTGFPGDFNAFRDGIFRRFIVAHLLNRLQLRAAYLRRSVVLPLQAMCRARHSSPRSVPAGKSGWQIDNRTIAAQALRRVQSKVLIKSFSPA
jgi:hypothetical protein